MDPFTLGMKVNPACEEYKIVGICYPRGYLVHMYVPVAFLETVGAPGDTLVAAPNFASFATAIATQAAGMVGKVGQSNKSGMDNSSESNVWVFPDSIMKISPIVPKCLVCLPSDAVDATLPLGDGINNPCGASSILTDRLTSMNQGLIDIPYMPKLAYSSSMDVLNWRTGCRDMSISKMALSNAVNCMATNAADMLGGSNNPLSSVLGDYCLGSWGTLYPRQMRDVGNVATVASAKTGYRAMHVAKKCSDLSNSRLPWMDECNRPTRR